MIILKGEINDIEDMNLTGVISAKSKSRDGVRLR